MSEYIELERFIWSKIPTTISEDPNRKYLIQGLDDKALIMGALFKLLYGALEKCMPDRRPMSLATLNGLPIRRQSDSLRYFHIVRKCIYFVEEDAMKRVWAIDKLNSTRFNRHTSMHIGRANPETFEYWDTQFDVLISENPVRVSELLKPAGILIKI